MLARRFALPVGLLCLASPAWAGPPLDPPAAEPTATEEKHVPLSANFAGWELLAMGGIAAWNVSAYQATACKSCSFGGPSRIDRDVSNALYQGPGAGKLMRGFPDALGLYIAPAVSGGVYLLVDPLVQLARGRGMFGSPNVDHKAAAFFEAFGLTLAITQTAKVTTGRTRPYFELGRTDPALKPSDDLSFFSGHASVSFTVAAFVYRDFSDWLVAPARLGPQDPWVRIAVGRILPALVLYGGATLVGVSRIVDQAHYLSDVGVGALVGTAIGNAVYALHFDARGRPREPWKSDVAVNVTPFPGGAGVAGRF